LRGRALLRDRAGRAGLDADLSGGPAAPGSEGGMSTLVSTTPAVAVRPVKRYRLRRRLGDALTYLGLAVALVFFLGPFFWILTTSLKGNSDFFAFPPVWIPHDPS